MIDDIISKLKSGAIHTVEEWDSALALVGATHEDEIRCLMAAAIKTPQHALLISTLFLTWRGKVFKQKISTVKAVDGVEAPAHSNSKFFVDDIICLEARSTDAKRYLQRWGKWWRIQRGYNNNTQYMLQSLYGKNNKREEPKGKVELLIIGKLGDLHYNVVNVVKAPCSPENIPS